MGTQGADQPQRWPLRTPTLSAPSERERLLAAMAMSCAEHGYAGASVGDVLARSGLDGESFERQFTSKEECALAAIDEMLAEATRAVAEASRPGIADWRRLLGATHALLELIAARPSYARLAFIEARNSMPHPGYERYAALIRVVVAMLERVRAYASGGAPALATRAAIGGPGLLIRRELLAGRAERLPELLPDIIYGTVVPFLPQQEALHYAELARELVEKDGGVK